MSFLRGTFFAWVSVGETTPLVREIMDRIAMQKRRLDALRARPKDSTVLIGIQAIEQELTRLARGLPPEWNLSRSSLREDDRGDSPVWP